jgi:hypothetical protein
VIHSHARERNARQPARSSASVPARAVATGAPTLSRLRNAALAMNVVASIASPHFGPSVATITPAIAGPSTEATLLVSASSALAGWSWSAATVWGSNAVEAGPKNATAAPYTAWRAASSQTRADPLSSRAALAPWVTARTQSDASITRWRARRSAQTPPSSTNTTSGTVWAASTMPRSLTEPVSSRTANARATGTRRLPTEEIASAANSSRNGREPIAAPNTRQDYGSLCPSPTPGRACREDYGW